jgi:hypothetical protein
MPAADAAALTRRAQPGLSAAVWILGLALGAGLVAQARLITTRWINADEGAHLMDARLTLQGMVPAVHFEARQPLYVYAYVPFLRAFGETYVSGRLMPLAAGFAVAWLIYLIGRRAWDAETGSLAAALYLLSPTIFINMPVVKTEPLAMLLMGAGAFGLLSHFQRGGWAPLALAGAAFGAGYYVRESTLAGPLAGAGLILLHARQGWGITLRRLAVLTAGYAAVIAAMMAAYLPHLPLPQILAMPTLSPWPKIRWALGNILEAMGVWGASAPVAPSAPSATPEPAAVSSGLARAAAQRWETTLRNLAGPLRLQAHLLLGAAAAAVLSCVPRAARPDPKPAGRIRSSASLGIALAGLWLGALTLLYAYHTLRRGFFQFYFRELIPPLTLLAAFAAVELLRRLRASPRRSGAAIACTAALAAMGIAGGWAGWQAATQLSVAFDCTWSPRTVREASALVRAHSGPDDEVISGAVIWEFEAARRPFLNISHPLVFVDRMWPSTRSRIQEGLRQRPPRVIVLDGYTERTYLRQVAEVAPLLERAYRLAGEVGGSKYPVRVYVLAEAHTPAPGVAP